jgi:hypothetical protein
MSREKLLAKLLMAVQSLTYSCCCESFDAIRSYRKSISVARGSPSLGSSSSTESILSKYGITGIACDWKLVVMPIPSPEEDEGSQPFDGRLGRLRYLALAAMAAAGALAADLIQIVLPFPPLKKSVDEEECGRSPIASPILFGHVLTHVVAAMCATCGTGRARGDSLDLHWPIPTSKRGSSDSSSTQMLSVTEDCRGFLKLGLLARLIQVLLGELKVSPSDIGFSWNVLTSMQNTLKGLAHEIPFLESSWIAACLRLLEVALAESTRLGVTSEVQVPSPGRLREVCASALSAATSFLADAGLIFQILVPAVAGDMQVKVEASLDQDATHYSTFEKMRQCLKLETIEEMLNSPILREVIAGWYEGCCAHAEACSEEQTRALSQPRRELKRRLLRTHGFRTYDWPLVLSQCSGRGSLDKGLKSDTLDASPMHVDAVGSLSFKTTVSLFGCFAPPSSKAPNEVSSRHRISALATSYTDLYSELGSLMPECEQTAVCLVCGEVLNANGKGECTRHSYKCGSGAGIFFLLQECSGLIMHKSKAAYIHSPYVDSYGETPQFRGRPLNLDLARYEHLRDVWTGHMIRQTVVAERSTARQVILPDYY